MVSDDLPGMNLRTVYRRAVDPCLHLRGIDCAFFCACGDKRRRQDVQRSRNSTDNSTG
jgi:hypothetical protein